MQLLTRHVPGAVALALLTSLAGAASLGDTEHGGAPAIGRVFAPTSFWYTPVPADAPLHPSSASFVAEFLRQKKAYYGTVAINTVSYSSPVYVAGPEVATVRVTEWDCQKKGRADASLAEQWQAVPIPAHAAPSIGHDGEMTIYQPVTDTVWEFWKARKVDGQWQGCWGGRLRGASLSDGRWPSYYGTTATGLPFLGGQITAEELRRGEIRHAIGISLVDAEHHTTFSWPAKRSDGYNPTRAPNRIPEGARFRLDPTVNVDALPMHPIGKVIAKAAQKYGFVVWDKAGAISLRAQNALSYMATGQPNPYPDLFDGKPTYSILQGMPWERLQFLPHDYGKP
jgi:hypothetical protein